MKTRLLSILLTIMMVAGSVQAQTFSLKQKRWSKTVNTSQDISKLNYAELFYLKALVNATHGCWYEDAEVNATLLNKCDWYVATCLKRAEKYTKAHDGSDEGFDYEKVTLTSAEKAFVQKIDKRMQALEAKARKDKSVEPAELCINMNQIASPSAEMLKLLNTHNIAFQTTECEQLFNIYEENEYTQMPNFVTSDTYLQLAHMYLAYVQKYVEQNFLSTALQQSFANLQKQAATMAAKEKGEARALLEWVQTYAAIGVNLSTDKTVQNVPSAMQTYYAKETKACRNYQDAPSEFMRCEVFSFPYSLFRPRGHYTRNDAAKCYFHGMMWMQTASFSSNDEVAMKRAMMLAVVYNNLTQKQRDIFEGMDKMIEQMMGTSDNVSILKVAAFMRGQKLNSAGDVLNKSKYGKVKAEMDRMNEAANQLSTDKENLTGYNVNMMPQRFMVDNDVLQNMADKKANAERAFPRGIDVFAAFGSQKAEDLQLNFFHDDKAWGAFTKRSAEMKQKYGQWGEGITTVYDKRLKILVDLASKRQSTPYAFYNTDAWLVKDLNTTLASWATLKHDAILYAEQPMMAECGDGNDLPLPIPMAFVEPNVLFWDELASIITDTRNWMKQLGYLDEQLDSKTDELLQSVELCQKVARKEVMGQAPDLEERSTLSRIGSSVEWLTLGFLDPELSPDTWSAVQGADRQIAQVADIFTRGVGGCQKNGIKYAALGNANAMYVLVRINGKVYLTRGATYGYHEFVLPLDTPRLTDEEWQKMLEDGTAPSLPDWLLPFYMNKPAKINEREFYSTGC